VPGQSRGHLTPARRSIDVDDEWDLYAVEKAWQRGLPWNRCGHVMIIAEIGVNHNGDMARAMEMVETAARLGADAVKFQIFKTSEFVSKGTPKANYQERNTGNPEDMSAMLRSLELGAEALRALADRSRELGIMFSASPFDLSSVKLLDSLEPDFIKIPSGEATNLPLLRAVAATMRPVILSTGMCTLAEVDTAVDTLRRHGAGGVALLQCTSDYPAPPAECNLRTIPAMHAALDLPVGFSDHTTDTVIAAAAVGLGAGILEKHFTLDHDLPGPDHVASCDPEQFADYVHSIRCVEAALGSAVKRPMPSERSTADVARKSLVAAVDIRKGQTLTADMLTLKRPGTGLAPAVQHLVVGLTAGRDIPADSVIEMDMFR
jgi:sialic acid synthase SpsE